MHVCQIEKGLIVVVLYCVSWAGLNCISQKPVSYMCLVRVGHVRDSSEIFRKPECSNSYFTHCCLFDRTKDTIEKKTFKATDGEFSVISIQDTSF